jgi:ribosomal protein L29
VLQVAQLNVELMLMGELHQKYQQRLAETTDVRTTELFNLRSSLQSATAESNGVFYTVKYQH